MLVYVVSNRADGRRYVGRTTGTLEARWEEHKARARTGSGGFGLHRAMREHGSASFEAAPLARAASFEELLRLEAEWIERLGTRDPALGYNRAETKDEAKAGGGRPRPGAGTGTGAGTETGSGTGTGGRGKSPEQRAKMAERWDLDRCARQAEVARRVNAAENAKARDYLCPSCGALFQGITRPVYGGHRKACLARYSRA